MFKFFGRIRRDLIARNRLGKYLAYAFGEVILVVIGILIALQLNNWNQERINGLKRRENRIDSLCKRPGDPLLLYGQQLGALDAKYPSNGLFLSDRD